MEGVISRKGASVFSQGRKEKQKPLKISRFARNDRKHSAYIA